MRKEVTAKVYKFNGGWAFDIHTHSEAFRCIQIGYDTKKEATIECRKRCIEAATVVEGAK